MQTSPSEVSRTGDSKSFSGRELWLLAGSQDMYGAETLAQVESQWREVATALDAVETIPAAYATAYGIRIFGAGRSWACWRMRPS